MSPEAPGWQSMGRVDISIFQTNQAGFSCSFSLCFNSILYNAGLGVKWHTRVSTQSLCTQAQISGPDDSSQGLGHALPVPAKPCALRVAHLGHDLRADAPRVLLKLPVLQRCRRHCRGSRRRCSLASSYLPFCCPPLILFHLFASISALGLGLQH